MANAILTQEHLKELFNYDPGTGNLVRLVRTSSNANIGDIVGYKNTNGHLQVRINGKYLLVHRVIWLYMNGSWPLCQIDHVNGVRTDNRLKNLREVSSAENSQNRRNAHSNNITGLLGVSPHGKNYQTAILANGKRKYIGTFKTPELAHEAYLKAKRELHSSCTI